MIEQQQEATHDAAAMFTELQAQCATLEGILTIGNRVAPAVLATQRPGGDENADTGWLGWLAYFKWLHRSHALLDAAPGSGPEGRDAEELDDVLAASLGEEPIAVDCSDGVRRLVYPKSFHSLRWLESLSVGLRFALAEAELATSMQVLSDATLLALYPLMESWSVRMWAWIVTTEGSGLPFADGERPEPPAWTGALTPEDILRLGEAHLQVHRRRLSILGAAVPAKESQEKQLSLAGFIGVMGMELGRPSRSVMRETSLGGLFAAAVSKARSERAARDAAGSGERGAA